MCSLCCVSVQLEEYYYKTLLENKKCPLTWNMRTGLAWITTTSIPGSGNTHSFGQVRKSTFWL